MPQLLPDRLAAESALGASQPVVCCADRHRPDRRTIGRPLCACGGVVGPQLQSDERRTESEDGRRQGSPGSDAVVLHVVAAGDEPIRWYDAAPLPVTEFDLCLCHSRGGHQLLHVFVAQRQRRQLRGSVPSGHVRLQSGVHGAQRGTHRQIPGQFLRQSHRPHL